MEETELLFMVLLTIFYRRFTNAFSQSSGFFGGIEETSPHLHYWPRL